MTNDETKKAPMMTTKDTPPQPTTVAAWPEPTDPPDDAVDQVADEVAEVAERLEAAEALARTSSDAFPETLTAESEPVFTTRAPSQFLADYEEVQTDEVAEPRSVEPVTLTRSPEQAEAAAALAAAARDQLAKAAAENLGRGVEALASMTTDLPGQGPGIPIRMHIPPAVAARVCRNRLSSGLAAGITVEEVAKIIETYLWELLDTDPDMDRWLSVLSDITGESS